MYKTKKRIVKTIKGILTLILVAIIIFLITPYVNDTRQYSAVFRFVTACVVFTVISVVLSKYQGNLLFYIRKKDLFTKETGILNEFIDKMRFCYSLDDFYEAIGSILEMKGDCSVLLVDREKNYVLYNSPDRLSCSAQTMRTLELNYPADWRDGYCFIGEELGIVTKYSQSRGFILSKNKIHLYVFCRYTRLFDLEIYKTLIEEFERFLERSKTISDLSEIASLSREWKQLADTQQSFLPLNMPKIDKLSIAAYYRPLVNVSGDYYSVLPISPTKTLLMLGDVSGKGLAAALVMGLVMNTAKILEDKEDLPGMIMAIHKAIKGMKLQDKYTVLFLGVVDTEKMVIRYVNASMSDPLIITNSPSGYRIKPLTSNCSLVGIIDIDEVEVAEQRLFRDDVILMASDGVSEVMNDEGVELGDTELYENTIKKSAAKSPKEFIDDVVNLIMDYNGGKKLRDDVTMMVAKVER
ncbi:PP2C family protein-serine/threonine phosphatase [Treponema sp.]|uniref:PP2C family protein-serine/threonine phosphatase n=1 Tax=Treponema sp. TaxID=166 RepID=UPI00298DFB9C|nr:SpoIIE family protein phosphatase [Treponema sp.]MCQ2241627.1 SpoIIE family protein phosphatase [Treponema sp.]